MMLNKTFHLLLLSLIPLLGFSQANSQYPNSGNKIRLGFQTSGDGLIWRDTQPNVGVYQPINNKAAWIVLDTVNNKFYHYKNSAWTLAGGQDIDTANLIATKYNLGFKLTTTDTGNMLTPYWRSGRFSGVLPVANGGTNITTFTAANRIPYASSATALTTTNKFTFDPTGNKLIIGKNDSLDSNPNFTINLSGSDEPSPILGFRLYNTTLNKVSLFRYDNNHSFIFMNNDSDNGLGSHRFKIGSGNGEEILTITRPTASGTDGRVGIGTTSPTAKLHVAGDGLFSSTSATTTQIRLKASGSATGFDIQSSANDGYLWNRDNGAFYFGTNNTQRLVISSTGAATFSSSVTAAGATFTTGTSNTQLTVNGTGAIKSGINFANGGTTYGQIYFDNNAPYNMSVLQQYTTGSLILGTNNTANLTIANGGNVGIGTTTPTGGQLQISGNSDSGTNPNRPRIALENLAGTPVTWTIQPWSTSGDANLSIYRTGAAGNILLASTGGNVGIGTGSPNAILDVVGANTTDKLTLSTYTTGATGSNIRLKHARGTVASPTTIVNADDLGQFIFQGYDGTNFLNGAQIKSGVDAVVSNGVMPGFISFLTNQGFERMRITSTGNVGIGTDSPITTSGTPTLTIGSGGAQTPSITLFSQTGQGQISFAKGLTSTDPYDGYILYNSTSRLMAFGTAATERMRITSDGNVNIGTTSITTDDGITLYSTGQIYSNVAGTTSNQQVRFYRNNTVVGSITTDASTTSYITSSDYRLKQDFKDYNGLNLISAIKTYNYEWKSDNTRTYGVLAHELQEVIPQAVFGEKDGKEMQGVDYSKLVPILIKSVQELSAEIDILKQEIINLKNK